jgi:hypothetical protein
MIVNNINELIENYKQLKKSFKVRESANYIELVTSTGQKIYQNKSKRFTGGLYLFGMVKKDIKNYLEENGEVEPYEELPVNYINKEFNYEKDVIGMDINNAYWSVAYLKGYISQNTYEKGLEKDDLKRIRLASLSSLGKSRMYNVYINGEHQFDEEQAKNQSLQNVYLDIRYSTYGVMQEIAYELGDDFCCWKTDCIFFHDTEKNREKVKSMIEDYGLECKLEYYKKLKPLSV